MPTHDVTPATYVKRRRVSGWKKPPGAVSCTRGRHPNEWGNPFGPGDALPDGGVVLDHDHAVQLYADLMRAQPERQERARSELAGKILMCWCAPGQRCHVQTVLIPLVNEGRLP